MKKKDKKWVVLCSTAVAAVYAAGYFTTETQAIVGQPKQQIEKYTQVNRQPLPGTKENGEQTPNETENESGSNSTSSNPPKANHSQKKNLYKDGTFTGSGMNRRGSIDVQVTIKSDKITDVEISNFAMHYSEDDVVGLPGEVVQKQSAQVKNVSGATYSTQAFADAVQSAINQAHNQAG
jgi:uncharacterized protein with FMN-binding domain